MALREDTTRSRSRPLFQQVRSIAAWWDLASRQPQLSSWADHHRALRKIGIGEHAQHRNDLHLSIKLRPSRLILLYGIGLAAKKRPVRREMRLQNKRQAILRIQIQRSVRCEVSQRIGDQLALI